VFSIHDCSFNITEIKKTENANLTKEKVNTRQYNQKWLNAAIRNSAVHSASSTELSSIKAKVNEHNCVASVKMYNNGL
jgi:hypothetical protein